MKKSGCAPTPERAVVVNEPSVTVSRMVMVFTFPLAVASDPPQALVKVMLVPVDVESWDRGAPAPCGYSILHV